MMQVITEMLQRIYLCQHLLSNTLMTVLNLTDAISLEVLACLQIQVLAERKAS